MTTVPANAVRIPAAAREALARREVVTVLSHGRPAYIIVSPDAYEALSRPQPAVVPRGRKLSEALELLAAAPRPDPDFADDLEAIIMSAANETSPDRWESS